MVDHKQHIICSIYLVLHYLKNVYTSKIHKLLVPTRNFPAYLFKTQILDSNISFSQVNNFVVEKISERYPIFHAKNMRTGH